MDLKVNWTDDFKKLYQQRGQQKHGIRLLALWKIQSGITETAVCDLLNKTHKTIQAWRKLYEVGGLDALLSIGSGRGCKAKVDLSEKLFSDINALSTERKGGRIRCQDIVDLVHSKYGIKYSKPGMYHLIHRLGFSWITSRSRHPKNNPEAMETFKKTLKA